MALANGKGSNEHPRKLLRAAAAAILSDFGFKAKLGALPSSGRSSSACSHPSWGVVERLSGFKSGKNAQVSWGGSPGAAGGPARPREVLRGQARPGEEPGGNKLFSVAIAIFSRQFDGLLHKIWTYLIGVWPSRRGPGSPFKMIRNQTWLIGR
jgi:hypothetical protein